MVSRLRMVRSPLAPMLPLPLPVGYELLRWDNCHIPLAADVLLQSFREELDGELFPNLVCPVGSVRLATAICELEGFCPAASWILNGPRGTVGAVQAVILEDRLGAIQNIGVIPEERGRGFGAVLLAACLDGFAASGARRAYLDVTQSNTRAVALYRRFGFRPRGTHYRLRPGHGF
ncbi:MAG: GNAT family N-acetyltransferase [Gemmataceae bacterium]